MLAQMPDINDKLKKYLFRPNNNQQAMNKRNAISPHKAIIIHQNSMLPPQIK